MWLGLPHLIRKSRVVRCLGTPVQDPMCMKALVNSINELDKKVSSVVKTTTETTLEQRGTVGAMAVEELIDRLKACIGNAGNVGNASGASALSDPGLEQTPVVAPPRGSTPIRGGGSVASSPMPSAFGDVRSVMASGVSGAVVPKPGKNLIRSHDGF